MLFFYYFIIFTLCLYYFIALSIFDEVCTLPGINRNLNVNIK